MATIEKEISIVEKEISLVYEIDTYRYIKSPEEPIENRIQYKVKKTFIHKDEIGYLFSLEILKRKQSSEDEILYLEDQLALLQKNLTIYTNKNGEVISIVNLGEITDEWYEQKKVLQKDLKNIFNDIDTVIEGIDLILNDPSEFLNMVKKSEVVMLLFPPIYNNDLLYNDHIEQSQVLYDFFDTTALPFKMSTKLIAINENNGGYQIARSGDLDNTKFDIQNATKVMSTLFNVHSYNITIEATCFEAYDLAKDNTIDEASILMNVEIPGIYSYRQISKLKKI